MWRILALHCLLAGGLCCYGCGSPDSLSIEDQRRDEAFRAVSKGIWFAVRMDDPLVRQAADHAALQIALSCAKKAGEPVRIPTDVRVRSARTQRMDGEKYQVEFELNIGMFPPNPDGSRCRNLAGAVVLHRVDGSFEVIGWDFYKSMVCDR